MTTSGSSQAGDDHAAVAGEPEELPAASSRTVPAESTGETDHDGATADGLFDVVVVGGGIAGLTAAHDLVVQGHTVRLVEAADRVGGKLWARDLDGVELDVGADAMLARHGAGVELAASLGLELSHPVTGSVQLVADGVLRRLPAGTMLGVPTDLVALARSRVLSPAGLVRASLEAVWPRRARIAGDRSIADVVADRYGSEVVERLVEPMLGGIYAGRPDRLSVQATAPAVAEADRHGRSLAHALQHVMASRRIPGPVFATPTTSMASLAAALVEAIVAATPAQQPPVVQLGWAVSGISGRPGRWRVATAQGEIHAHTVVVAVPAHVATTMLTGVAPGTAVEVAGIRHASVGVVSMAFGTLTPDDLPDASGVLVPRREGRLVKAGTWLARKWPHLTDHGAILRVSVGRVDDLRWQGLDDDELVTAVVSEVADLTGLDAKPTASLVTRWYDAMPQYDVGHLQRVDRARHHLPDGVVVTGAAYDGIGVSPCVESGHQAAWGVMQELGRG